MNRSESFRDAKRAFFVAFSSTVPVLTGFLFLGTAYGVLMQTKGYGAFWSVLMSLVGFCGSMQFVAIALLASGFEPVQTFLLSLMVNARHLFYGISMLEKYRGLGKVKPFLIFTLCDETFSLLCSLPVPEGIRPKHFYFFVSLLNYLYWALGTLIGGVLGGLLTFNTKGLDFVLTALFVVLFVEQMKKPENRRSGLIGIACSVLALSIFGPDRLVIPAMLFILATLSVGRKKLWS